MTWAKNELGEPGNSGLYQSYRGEYGDESVKKVSNYGGVPKFRR